MMKKLLATTILAAIAAVASGVETQQTNNATRVNERIRSGLKQLGYPFVEGYRVSNCKFHAEFPGIV